MNELRLSASDVASIIATKHPTFPPLPKDFPRLNHDVERKALEEMMRTGISVRRLVVVDGGGYYPTVRVEVIDDFFIDPTSPPPPEPSQP